MSLLKDMMRCPTNKLSQEVLTDIYVGIFKEICERWGITNYYINKANMEISIEQEIPPRVAEGWALEVEKRLGELNA